MSREELVEVKSYIKGLDSYLIHKTIYEHDYPIRFRLTFGI